MDIDYYEFLQINRNAEPDTIHRVYRFLAGRLHPDNPETGDAEKFFLLKEAYDVLSNPERRAAYDATCKKEDEPVPLSSSIDFMGIDGESNRRLVLLALLYIQRRTNPYSPEVSLFEVEKRMGVPRDYLPFTTWYLISKGYITRSDSSEFVLTAEGVDFVESNRASIPVLSKLLTSDAGPSNRTEAPAIKPPILLSKSIIVPPSNGASEESKVSDRKSDGT